MIPMIRYLLIVLLEIAFLSVLQAEVRSIGSIQIPLPGLINRFVHSGASSKHRYSILASSYSTSINSYDKGYMLYRPGDAVETNFTEFHPKILYNAFRWPKNIKQIPYSVFEMDAVTVGDGCRINGKTDGNVFVIKVTDPDFPETHSLTDSTLPTKNSFNYADAVWLYNPLLGKDNMITCRVKFNGDLLEAAQLVHFHRPTFGNELERPWSETVLRDSACDSNLVEHFHHDGRDDWDIIFATGLYTKRLVMFWPETDRGHVGDWDKPNEIKSVILSEGREFYDVHLSDVNGDGRIDLLVTVVSNNNGSVEVWEIPDDFRDPSKYVHHVIATGFTSRSGDKGRSPGVAKAFFPLAGQTGKPSIVVSGGDDGRAYYLSPITEATHEWDFEKITVADEGVNQAVGGVEVADVDGDGYTEVFVSVHNKNKIDVYTFLE